MARKIKAKLVLRLRAAGHSRSAIARTQGMSKRSVIDVFDAADELGIDYDDVAYSGDEEVYSLLFPDRIVREDVYADPDWGRVHRELARTGVTLKLLHAEYVDACAAGGSVAMGYDRFCKRYRAFTVASNVTSRVGHKAGRIVEVDWSGSTMAVVDSATAEVQAVYLFVGCLPFSRYSYVEPTLDMKQDTWLRCHVRMFEFFGGSAPCIVPDNLKVGVAKHPKEGEIVLNDSYQQMAAHYSAAVMPGRIGKPKDKPSVEGTVGNIATDIIAELRNAAFTSLDALRAAVREKLDAYNSKPFQKRAGSRRASFESEEKPLLRPLPAVPYEICEWVYGRKVQANCHVSYKRNFYSVSYLHVGAAVDLRVTDSVLEVYLGGERLATHRLFPAYTTNAYSTNELDMPQGRSYSDWDAGRIRRWAARIGESCADVVDRVFSSVRFDEQGFNAALAVLRLSRKYGSDRLEKACAMALASGVGSPRYRHIEPILATNQDKIDDRGDSGDDGGWVRGADYYGEE